MARLLGEAYIAILPQTDQFGSQLRAAVDKDAAAVRPEVNVGAQLSKADIAKIGTQLKAVSKANPISVGVNLDKTSVARMAAQLAAYTKAHTIDIGTKLDMRQLAKMQTQMQAFLSGKDMEVGVQLNPAQLAKIQGTYDAFVKEMNDEKVSPNWNILPALSRMAMLKSANASLTSFIQEQNARNNVNLNIMPALAQIVELKAAEATLDKGPIIGPVQGPQGGGLLNQSGAIAAMARSLINLTSAEKANDATVNGLGRHYGIWGAAISVLQTRVALFGGALTALHFPDVIAQASGWHILAEAVIETAAVWIPATIAAVAFGLAGYKSAKQVYTQITSMNQVMNATGAKFTGMTNSANSLANAVKPQVYQLFGDYLLLAGKNSGALSDALQTVGRGLDKIGAKVVQLAGNGGGFAKFVANGSKDLDLLIAAFGQVGRIIDVFIRSVPGYAEMLLGLGVGFLKVTADVLSFLQPVIKIALALHGAIFYLGLATTVLLSFGRAATFAAASVLLTGVKVEGTGSKIANLGTAFGNTVGVIGSAGKAIFNYSKDVAGVSKDAGLAAGGSKILGDAMEAIPFGPAGIAAAGLAAIIGGVVFLAFHESTDAATKLNDALEKTIAASNISDIQKNIAAAITQTTHAIAQQSQQVKQMTAAQGSQAQEAQVFINSNTTVSQSVAAGNQQINEMRQNRAKLTAQEVLATSRINDLSQTYGGLSSAQELVTLSGIKQSDVANGNAKAWATDKVQIDATAAAYGFMGQQAGAAGNQLDTLLLSQSKQVKASQALTGAESSFIAMLTGGTTALYAFEQGQKGGANASLTAANAFAGQVTAGETLYGNLQNLSAASNNTKTSQIALGKAGKDLVAQLLPMAKGSSTATAQLYGLAQIAGYQGPDSFKALSKWLGNTKGAEADLTKQTGILTKSSANLAEDMKNLASTMSGQVDEAMAQAIFFANGGQKAFNKLALALKSFQNDQTPAHFKAIENALRPVAQQLIATVGPGQAAENMFIAMAAKMNINAQEAKYLWAALNLGGTSTSNLARDTAHLAATFNSLNGPLKLTTAQVQVLWANLKNQDLDMVSGKADNTKQAFINFATNGLHLTTQKADELWAKLKQQGLDTLANKASTTKSQFINLAKQGLGLTTQQASALWSELRLQYLDTLAQKGDSAKNSFINLAKQGLGLTNSQAAALWNTLKQQYLDTLANKAGETELAFEKTARQFGLNKQAADALWSSLHNLAGGSPYNVAVQELLSGSGSISAKISAAGIVLGGGGGVLSPAGAANATKPSVPGAKGSPSQDIHAAAGAWISGNHSNVDSVPVMAKPGELIVPPTHAAAVANHMAAGGYKVPGFSSGGLVSQAPILAKGADTATQNVETDVESFAKLVNSAFSSQASSAFQAAQGEGGAYGGPSSFGGGFESLSALVSFARYFMSNGLNAAAAAGMAATISGEEDSAGPESRNCVPLTYKVVTTRGVLAHDEVRVGDKTMGYNLETGQTEMATILDVPYHDDAEMCRIGNGNWSVVCTVDHKWITASRGLVRADRLRMGERIMLDENWTEQVYTFERFDNADTFCLTTTTGTWTVLTEEGDVIWTGNSDGWGLIGWTGNTVGLPAGYTGPTGNVAYDLQEQLKGVIGYMNAKGGPGPLNAAGNAVAAGQVWSRYEGPASPLSDTRSAIANEIYASLVGTAKAGAKAAVSTAAAIAASIPKITLAGGGWIKPSAAYSNSKIKPHSAGGVISEPVFGFGANSGTPYSFAENGPEMVSPSMNSGGNDNFAQPMTQSQGQALIQLMQQNNTLLAQQPYNTAKAVNGGASAGMRSRR